MGTTSVIAGRPRRVLIGAVVLALALFCASACSAGQGAKSASGDRASSSLPAPGLTPSASTGSAAATPLPLPVPWTSATGTAAQQAAAIAALRAYRGMWADLAKYGQFLDGWKNPALGAHMINQPLVDWVKVLQGYSGRGVVSSGLPRIDPRVVKVDNGPAPRQVEIADCFDNTGWIEVFARNHQPTDRQPGTRERTEALVNLDWDGYWKVTQQIFGKPGTC